MTVLQVSRSSRSSQILLPRHCQYSSLVRVYLSLLSACYCVFTHVYLLSKKNPWKQKGKRSRFEFDAVAVGIAPFSAHQKLFVSDFRTGRAQGMGVEYVRVHV